MTSREALTTDQANTVYDLLIEHAGASPDGRDDFIFLQTDQHVDEYRFGGALGFGGKFWNHRGRWYVTAYPEAVKVRPELRGVIEAANAALKAAREEAGMEN